MAGGDMISHSSRRRRFKSLLYFAWTRALAITLMLAAGTVLARIKPHPPDAPPTLQEQLQEAATLRRAGEWDKASALLKELWVSDPAPKDKTAALAYGRLCLMKGEAAQAEAPLREVADSNSALAPYGKWLLGQCLLTVGKAGEAAELARALSASRVAPSLRLRSMLIRAEAEASAGKHIRAADLFLGLASQERSRDRADGARFSAAREFEAAGLDGKAFSIYGALYRRPACLYGHRSALALRRLASSKGLKVPAMDARASLAFARRLLSAGRREDALDALDAVGSGTLKGDLAVQKACLRISALYALRDNAAAAAEADRALETFGPSRSVLQAAMKAAWAVFRTGDHAAVTVRCRRILQEAPDDGSLQAEALHCMGTSAYVHGLFREAAEDFEKVAALDASRSTLASALYKRAWCMYRMGDSEGARGLFREIPKRYPRQDYEGPCTFWAARSGLGAGEREAAIEGFVALAEEPPGYWSWRARVALARLEIPLPSDAPPPDLPEPWEPSCVSPETALAMSLDLSGLEGDAAEAFEPYYRKHSDDASTALTFALMAARSGRFSAAQSALNRAFGPATKGFGAPLPLLAGSYPAPDLGWVRPLASKSGVDPALVLAVIRQESFFDESSLSPAGAQGLMQLMDDTAQRLFLPEEEPVPPLDLMNPALNLKLGTRYLGRLLSQMPSAAVVASYNAGEDVVSGWVKAFSPLNEEEFVAMIPYQETRHYTAQVLWNWHVYQRILADEEGTRQGSREGWTTQEEPRLAIRQSNSPR
jgi:soluble lytic murein transglycosylase